MKARKVTKSMLKDFLNPVSFHEVEAFVSFENLLKEDYVEIAILYYRGCTHQEIADILGCSKTNITRKLSNIIKTLKESDFYED